MYICEHLRIEEDDELAIAYTYTYPSGETQLLCDDCASMNGFCVYCFAYTGEDMSVPEEEQQVGLIRMANGEVFTFGTVRVCSDCAEAE